MENQKRKFLRPTAIIVIVLLYVAVLVEVLTEGESSPLLVIVRIGALAGYVSVFLSTVLAGYLREVRLIFGRPFMSVHHWFAALGLVFMTAHPVAFAIYAADLTVFIPDVSSWLAFWALAGRPALYMAYVATLAALMRNRIKNYWRYLHALMYVVLVFAFIHGYLIGASFVNPLIVTLFLGMLIVAFGVGIKKRLPKGTT